MIFHLCISDQTSYAKEKPGIRSTERMVGEVTLTQDLEVVACEFILTIESDDVEKMIGRDPKHRASIPGIVICKCLSHEPLTVSSGKYCYFLSSRRRK